MSSTFSNTSRLRAQSNLSDLDPRLRDSTASDQLQLQHGQYPQNGSPHQNIHHFAPPSAGNTPDHDTADGMHDGNSGDPKRPRACEACRGLKVRCEFDIADKDGPCRRCRKASRQCVVTVASRKRQKKTDSRVAELEKKIDALTATLHATKPGPASATHGSEGGIEQQRMGTQGQPNSYQQVTSGGYGTQFGPEARMSIDWPSYSKPAEFDNRKPSAPPMVVAGQKRKHAEGRDYPLTPDMQSPSIGGAARTSVDIRTGSQQGGVSAPSFGYAGTKAPQMHEYADVIDRGLITAEMATKMFNCYVEKMALHMPAVVFSPETTAADIRKTKPTLFLAIVSASSGMNYPQYQKMLTKEVMSIYAERIICNGEKTLELVQALHISTLWYWPPEHFEELKFYQLIHIAAVMAIDIGMGKRSRASKGKNAGLWRDHPWRRTPYPDPEGVEARRAWLGCYFLCCNAAMGLRRPNLIRWSSFMADCIEALESSPDAADSDKVLCQWVRSQHIAEEIGTQFSMDDPMANVSIADSKIQYALKGFERELDKWTSQVPTGIQSPALKMTGHVVNLYMHEVAMHIDHNKDEFKPPFTEQTLRPADNPISLTTAHISALSTCLSAIDGILDTFLKFDIETIRSLPVAHFVHVAYAVVVLIKMFLAAATPNSELGKVIKKEDMKVEQHLDGLVNKFKASSADEKSCPSAKVLMVLIMLKTWFDRQREGKLPVSGPGETLTSSTMPTARNDADKSKETLSDNSDSRQRQIPRQLIGYSPANTPLQVLSELATGDSVGQPRSGNVNNYPAATGEWPQPPHYGYDSMMTPNMSSVHNMGGGIDPSLGMNLGYSMGDGFEQAMGMTLGGVGEFGSYFNDDTFFGTLMDTVGGGPGFEDFQ